MPHQKKLTYITIGYWFLLLYMLAALVWWFIALNKQAAEMAELRISNLKPDDANYPLALIEAEDFRNRKRAQYIGEGSIIFLLLMVGAVLVYRATRRQIHLGRQQQNFMMAITHELKTPIAVTKLSLETMLKRQLDEPKRKELIESALQETDRLNDLANNILLASRMEGGAESFQSELVDLSQAVAEMGRQFQLRYLLRPIEVRAGERIMVAGDPLLLRILISNLLDNALKYTPDPLPVQIGLIDNVNNVLLQVEDHGPGIADEEKSRVFQKFYRVGSESTRTAKGTGLGLYLCNRIAQRHGAKIELLDNQPNGCIFRVVFKKNR